MVVGAKVCELTDGFLWFLCGNFDVSPKAFLTLIHWLVTAPVETFHSLEGAMLPSMTFPQSPVSTDASHVAPKVPAPILASTGMVLTEVEVQPQNQTLSKLIPL